MATAMQVVLASRFNFPLSVITRKTSLRLWVPLLCDSPSPPFRATSRSTVACRRHAAGYFFPRALVGLYPSACPLFFLAAYAYAPHTSVAMEVYSPFNTALPQAIRTFVFSIQPSFAPLLWRNSSSPSTLVIPRLENQPFVNTMRAVDPHPP